MKKKILKVLFIIIGVYVLTVLLLYVSNVIWISPSYFTVAQYSKLKEPVMSMESYMSIIDSHRRPYYYNLKSGSGQVHVMGVDHTTNPSSPELDSVRHFWEQAQPTVALVESRLGFLFKWTQDPVEKYGERGLTADLAKKSGAKLFTWEPRREDEIRILSKKYDARQLALFYVLRPYFAYNPNYRASRSEELINELIKERTDYEGLYGQLESWQTVAEMMKADYPGLDWETFSPNQGWPAGYLNDIWNDSNLSRDQHMIHTIVELVGKGETVFVTMGVSHAPRIENSLKTALTRL